MFAFMFIAYYATGVAGLVVVAVSTVLTFMRVWDGFTDPIIGFIIDRTKTKFGKFRPFMILGNVILAILTLVIFRTTHLVPEGLRFIYFVLMYGIYIIGYSFQTTCTRAAQTALTNDPKQRPMFSLFDALYNSALFIGLQNFVAVYLVPKHGGFTLSFFNEFTVIAIITSAVFTLLAVMAISSKDVEENWGIPGDKPVKFSEYWPILKGNRPLQMLVVSAATDKLAMTTRQNAVVSVIIYGILMSNYALSGQLMLITTPATIIITFIGIGYARKMGIKKAYVAATWICIALSAVFFIFLRMIDMTTISLVNFNTNTFVFLALLSLITGVSAVGGNIVIPMIAD
jgi:Na+/melibiose symporter-like transporter